MSIYCLSHLGWWEMDSGLTGSLGHWKDWFNREQEHSTGFKSLLNGLTKQTSERTLRVNDCVINSGAKTWHLKAISIQLCPFRRTTANSFSKWKESYKFAFRVKHKMIPTMMQYFTLRTMQCSSHVYSEIGKQQLRWDDGDEWAL